MGWGEPAGPACTCEDCSRPTLNSLHAELVEERAHADQLAAMLAEARYGRWSLTEYQALLADHHQRRLTQP